MLIKNYTKSGARMLSRLRIGDLCEPTKIRILWLSCYSSEDNPLYQTKKQHKHTYFEAHFIVGGSITYKTDDGRCFSLSQGEGVLIPPDERHIITEAGSGLVKMTLSFLPEAGSFLSDGLMRPGMRAFPIENGILGDLEDIYSEIVRRGSLSQAIIRARVTDLVCRISRAVGMDEHAGSPQNISTGDDAGLAMVLRYIEENSERLLSCKEVAIECHYSEKYLGRIFKEHTGMTLLSYIHNEKMKQAERLLADPSLSLRDVSAQLGFSSEYYFNSFFRRLSGVTPGQFRRYTCGAAKPK